MIHLYIYMLLSDFVSVYFKLLFVILLDFMILYKYPTPLSSTPKNRNFNLYSLQDYSKIVKIYITYNSF